MKILFVAPFGGVPGGISRWTEHIMNYYNIQDTPGLYIDLVSMGRTSFVNINSPLFYRLKCAYIDYRKILRVFHEKLKQNRYDVIHLTSSASLSLFKDWYILRRASKLHIKTIIHFHFGRIFDLSLQRNWEWRMLCKVISLADKVIVLDQKSYYTLQKEGFSNVILLPNPLSPIVKTFIQQNENINRIPRTILFVGHVVKTKGVFELVEACKQISNIQLKLLGHVLPSVKDLLEKEVDNAHWLHIEGEKDYEEVIREMLMCDLFILPTYTEGFPNVIVESMACGCAIVASKVGAIPEMLEERDGKMYGMLIESKSSSQIKDAIEFLINNESLKSEMRINAKSRVNERYNIDSVWRQLINIWRDVTKCS